MVKFVLKNVSDNDHKYLLLLSFNKRKYTIVIKSKIKKTLFISTTASIFVFKCAFIVHKLYYFMQLLILLVIKKKFI